MIRPGDRVKRIVGDDLTTEGNIYVVLSTRGRSKHFRSGALFVTGENDRLWAVHTKNFELHIATNAKSKFIFTVEMFLSGVGKTEEEAWFNALKTPFDPDNVTSYKCIEITEA